MQNRFAIRSNGTSVELYDNGLIFGTIRASGGWFTGTYFTADGQRDLDVYATPDEALAAMNLLPTA